ncbi:MAG: hypothetical protein ACLQVY_12135 [Limisphaerales bacterium]
MDSLELHDLLHVEAADGWLGIGNCAEANEELEKITPAMRSHPDVLAVRYEVYARAKQWKHCIEIADVIAKLAPESPSGRIRRSFALRKLKLTQRAPEKLLPGAH